MRTERVVAWDPGWRTGIAWASMSRDQFEFEGSLVLQAQEAEDWFAKRQSVHLAQEIPGPFEVPAFDVFVYETWRPRRDGTGSMDWIEGDELLVARHLGALEYIARRSGARPEPLEPADKHIHVASMPPNFAALDEDSNEQHDKDARQHLWGYFFRNWFTGTVDTADTVVLG